MSSSALSIWFDAIRPRTLPLAFVSISVGSGLAYYQQQFSWPIYLLALGTALLLQILSNLANDYGDALKGTDNAERIGPKRAMQQGLVTAEEMRKALGLNIALISILGSALLLYSLKNPHDFISFLGLGLLATLAALFYTIGNKPYGYLGLGDFSVLIFFGWIAVLGSFYLHVGAMDWLLMLPATASGLLSVAVLNINNLRDIDNDRASNKLTMVVRIGAKNGRIYHLALLSGAFILFIMFTYLSQLSIQYWLFLLTLPLAIKQALTVYRTEKGESLRPMLEDTVRFVLGTNILFIAPYFVG